MKQLTILLVLFSICFSTSANTAFAQLGDDLTQTTDFDGDGLGDLVLFDPGQGKYFLRGSSTLGFAEVSLGNVGDVPVFGDFNGDQLADLGTFDRSTATWSFSLNNGEESSLRFGNIADIPVPGFYSSTGCTDLATYNSRTTRWMIRDCSNNNQVRQFFIGSPGAVPAPADFDCDGKTDAAVFDRSSRVWTYRKSSDNEEETFTFGLYFDHPIPANVQGSRCAEAALYRPTSKHFIATTGFQNSSHPEPTTFKQWGLLGDKHGVFSVDGNNHLDSVIFRPNNNSFYIYTSNDNFFVVPFSLAGQTLHNPAPLLADPFTGLPPEILPLSIPVVGASQQFVTYKTKGDYNRDGRADLVVATVERSNYRTIWSIRHQDGTSSLSIVSAPGDALVPADYNGDGRTQPALVYVNPGLPAANNLEWHIKNADGTELIRPWGKNGDSPITGDFDCDGKSDMVVTRLHDNGFLYWYMWFASPFSPALGGFPFGMQGDRLFAADMNGDGCDEMIAAREEAGGITWYYMSLFDSWFQTTQWGLANDVILPPSDFDGDGRADFIVSRPTDFGGVYTFVNRSSEGPIAIPFGLTGDVVLSGAFSGATIGELAVYRRSNNSFFLRSFNGVVPQIPFGTSEDTLIRPDGSAVQPGDGNVGGDGGGGGGGGGASGCDVTTDFVDGGGGALWKPESDNTGKPVFLLPSEYWSSPTKGVGQIDVLGSNGDLIVNGTRRTCCPNGGRAHFDVPMHAGRLDDYAPITVKLHLNDGSTECREVPNPRQRYD